MKKLLILVFGMLLFFSGCEDKQKVIDINRTIKIGTILPLTGPVSDFGGWIRNGIELANEELKAKSSRLKLDILYEDSKFDAKSGVLAFNKLNNSNKIDICFTAMSKVAIPIINSNKNKIPIILQDVTYPDITKLDKYIFRHFIQSDREAEIMSMFIREKNITKLSVIYVNDEAGISAKTKLKENLNNIIVDSIAFSSQEINIRAIVIKAVKDNPNGIYVYGNGPSWAKIMKNLKEINYKGKIFTNTAMYIPIFRKIAGTSIENVYFTYPKINQNNKFKEFKEKYKEKYNEFPQLEAIYAYDLIMYIYDSLSKYPNIAIPKALEKNKEFDSLFNRLEIKNNDFLTPISIGQIINSKIVELQ